MSLDTAIEWTATLGPDGTRHPGATWNPWSGCWKKSRGCLFCYAAAALPSARRGAAWGKSADRVAAGENYLADPLLWNRKAAAAGVRKKVFSASMADLFERNAALDERRYRVLALMLLTPWLDWLTLTKEVDRMFEILSDPTLHEAIEDALGYWAGRFPKLDTSTALAYCLAQRRDVRTPIPNLWAGVTTEGQPEMERARVLALVPARVHFLSAEPLIERAVIPEAFFATPGVVRVVIAGGESGHAPGVRWMHPDWARALRDQCAANNTPFFFKQHGAWGPADGPSAVLPPEAQVYAMPGGGVGDPALGGGQWMHRLGKKRTGRELDGATHNDMPTLAVA